MTTNTLTESTLTADHVKVLRAADDSVSFYWDDGAATILARKQVKATPGFGLGSPAPEVASIPVSGAVFTLYDRDGGNGSGIPASCYYGVSSPRFAPEWVTVLSVLRPGDVLTPEWRTGNFDRTMAAAGIALEEFLLRVRRNDRVILTFNLGNQVGPVGSSGRLVKMGA